MLDKEAREYTAKVRQKDAKVAEVRERQRLMAKIADKDGILGHFGTKKVVGKSKKAQNSLNLLFHFLTSLRIP